MSEETPRFGVDAINKLREACGDPTFCPAWKDGYHCFEHATTWPTGRNPRTPQHSGYEKKGCMCGATVEATP